MLNENENNDVAADAEEEEVRIEDDNTIDTLVGEQLATFVESMKVLTINQGLELIGLVNNLPKLNSGLGISQTNTRILKYLKSKDLLPASWKGIKSILTCLCYCALLSL